MDRLETKILGSYFKNPIMPASGTYGYGQEYLNYYDPSIMGAIVSKGITYNPKEGNTGIRIWETPAGIMNSIGLENPGIHYFAKNILEEMKKIDTNLIVNLGGNSLDEYVEASKILNDYDFYAIELNISCPNVKHGGMAFGIEAQSAFEVTQAVKKVSKHKIIVKLSPNARDIVEIAQAVERAGADGISLVNTFLGMAIDLDKQKAVFENTYAGLSGPAIKPIALRMTHQVCKNVKIPVFAMGGIRNAKDALEFIMAGAAAVQIGTANFMNPNAIKEIIDQMDKYLEDHQTSIDQIRGIV